MTNNDAPEFRYAFEAELSASKIPVIPNCSKSRPVKSSAVIGAGTMGVGIAMSFINAGIPTKLLDVSPELIGQGLARIRNHYRRNLERGRLDSSEIKKRLDLISGISSYDDLYDVDIVVEAVFEDLNLKQGSVSLS